MNYDRYRRCGISGIWTACLVGAGGAIGALLRYGVGSSMAASRRPGYYGTLAVNLVGSLAMGVLIGMHMEQRDFAAYAFTGIGILGGLTTYSTLNVQKAALATSGDKRNLRVYLAATYLGGIGLTVLGVRRAISYIHSRHSTRSVFQEWI